MWRLWQALRASCTTCSSSNSSTSSSQGMSHAHTHSQCNISLHSAHVTHPPHPQPLTPTGPRVALGNITNSAVSSPTAANTKAVPSAQKPPRTPAAKRSLVLAAPKSTSAASAASAVPTPTLATPEPLIMKATRRVSDTASLNTQIHTDTVAYTSRL